MRGPRVKYAFIRGHHHEHRIKALCRVLRIHRSGYYAWLSKPLSDRAIEDQRLLRLIRRAYKDSGCSYGCPRVFLDLREAGGICGRHRVARVVRINRIRAQRSHKRSRYVAGKLSVVAPNRLQREFTVDEPNQVWVTDITCIRIWEGWLYLAAVMDLYSRKIGGWSMKLTLARDLVIDALLMAVWHFRPQSEVLGHSDQDAQCGSDLFDYIEMV